MTPPADTATLVVCGLNREAALATGPGVLVVAGGGNRAALDGRLAALDPAGLSAVISFGLAGGLDPALPVGAVVIPDGVLARSAAWPCDAPLTEALRKALDGACPEPLGGAIAGSDVPLLTVADKARVRADTEAVAVDMESQAAAAFAARHRLPFAALRVISDPAGRSLPAVAGRAMRPDGSVDVATVIRGVIREPGQLPGLIRTARDAAVAFRQLRRIGGLLRGRALVGLGCGLLCLQGGLLGLGGRLLGLEL